MRIAPVPFNEELRLQDLYAYDILDSQKEKDFDDLLEVAAHFYGCPIAAITFIDQERQWFKSKIGFIDDSTGIPRDVAFCAHTILDNDVLIVEDATKDERFCQNTLVTSDPIIRFYAGSPIVSAGGFRLGAICIIDNEPRELSRQEAKMLQILSRQISKLMELRHKNKLLRKKAEEELQMETMLLHKILQEHDAEKQSISTELHENIAQTLAATNFYLGLAEEESGTANGYAIQKSRKNIASLLHQVRELSQTISPSLLTVVDLKDLLAGALCRFHNESGMEVKLLYEGKQSVASSLALTVYRIVETQLQNISRHARATTVTVNINAFSCLSLSIRDNGVGFDSTTFRKGGGLTNIRSRVEALNGRVEIISSMKGGCELMATIPK